MRPGPGLVVMALAFISGARRGTGLQSGSSSSSSAIASGKLGGKFGEDNTAAGAAAAAAAAEGVGGGGRGGLARINPWLSACDLEPNSAPDLQITTKFDHYNVETSVDDFRKQQSVVKA
uniref:Uncharacterized protein n=1 Tax=Anopheles albimanus TaxID=7167 RepID=A0A182FEG2_ANOAL